MLVIRLPCEAGSTSDREPATNVRVAVTNYSALATGRSNICIKHRKTGSLERRARFRLADCGYLCPHQRLQGRSIKLARIHRPRADPDEEFAPALGHWWPVPRAAPGLIGGHD